MSKKLAWALAALCIFSSSLSHAVDFVFQDDAGPGSMRFSDDNPGDPHTASLRKKIIAKAGTNYVQACSVGSHTITFNGFNLIRTPGHMILNAPLEIPADCKASSIVINGADAVHGTEFETVIDGRNIPAGRCAFEINSPTTAVTLKNFTFVNLTAGSAALCVKTNTPTVLDSNSVGVRRQGLPAGHPLAGDGLVANPQGNVSGISVTSSAQNVTIQNNLIKGNTQNGVSIEGNKTKVLNNIIQNNGVWGIIISNGSNSSIIGNSISGNNSSVNGFGGAITLIGTSSVQNTISNNSIFSNNGLGIDLIESNGFIIPGPTLFSDLGDTPNNNIDFADDVIISPVQGNQFNFSANPHSAPGFVFAIEIYEVNPTDATDSLQQRDGRSYGEGRTLVHSGSVTVDAAGRIGINFPANSGSAYSATLSNGPDTSEFSAVATADATTPVCEGNDPLGSNNGTGIKAPAAPTDVVISRTGSSVVVSFKDNAENPPADGFKLERAEGACGSDGLNYTTLNLAVSVKDGDGRRSFAADTGANVSLNHCYKVTAFRNIPTPSGDHAGATCNSSAVSKPLTPGEGGPNTPPVVRIDPNPTQPTAPVVVVITDRSTNEDAFCVERADRPLSVRSCADIPDANYKSIGKVATQDKPGVGSEVTYNDPTAEAGKLYCYRAKIEVNGQCVFPSAPAEATKLNPDGSRPEPQTAPTDNLTLEGCSLNKSASSKFNLLSLIALVAVAPIVMTRAFRTRKV